MKAETKRSLEAIADMLGKQVRPGHPDYLSKADAAAWILRLLAEEETTPCKP